MRSLLPAFFSKRLETSDRAILLYLRWLFFMVLCFLFLYSSDEAASTSAFWTRIGLLGCYALSNIVLTWATRRGFSLERWSMPVFLIDLALIGMVLYHSVGMDMDLYLMCFLIIYLSTLGRRVRDALPLALVACVLYGLLLFHRHPKADLMDPQLLLRFPFFLVFALFTSYLSHKSEEGRRKLEQMKEVQHLLSSELQKAMVELRDKQTMLLQAEKLSAMGNMAGALAHEIRNPLSVIVGYVEDILQDMPPPDVLHKVLESVRRSAVRCQDLMSNLLSFARRPKESERFLLKDALEETLTLVRMSAKMSQVQCLLDIRATPTISARRTEIQQIFINLMSNAVDAMPKGGTLTVILDEDHSAGKDWVKVSVQDTGSGIPEDARKRIFEPFFTTKPVGKGTGLGLSIVQDIVRSCQGVLEVQSELHKGTTFVVYLPLDVEPVAEDVSVEPAAV
jgi:signal transduction histidine kinase